MWETVKIKIEEIAISLVYLLRTLPPLVRTVAVVCVIGIIPTYFAVRYGSQAYWNGRYKNFQVQARPSFQNPRAPTVSKVTVLPLGQNAYAAYAQVTNENFELSADRISYNFIFKTASGETALSSPGKLFLLPSQKKFVVAPRFTTAQPIVSGTLTLDDIHWQKRFSIPQVNLTAIRPDVSRPIDTDPFTVEAAVRNDSPYQLKRAELIILVYDKSRRIQLVTARQEFTVNPNEVRKFPVSLPGLSGSAISSIDLIPQTDVLDANNLLLMGLGGSGSNLQRPSTDNF